MKRATALTPLLLLAACSSPQPPAYTVLDRTEQTATGYADLLLPGANTSQARDAIEDYTDDINPEALELYYVKVIQAEKTDRYVCRARWYRDAASYRQHASPGQRPDAWPALRINCPET